LLKQNFTEIHSPKMIGGTSEGGAEVFRFQYMNQGPGCLAQSPQVSVEFRRTDSTPPSNHFEIG